MRYDRFLLYAIMMVAIAGAAAHCSAGDVEVIDGDTFHLGDTPVRLWGIDAPEMNAPCGTAAKAELSMFLEGRAGAVTCRRRQNELSFGRVVAQCFIGDIDIADAMVRSGMAFDWPHFSGGHYAAAEKWAEENRIGLWRFDECNGEPL